MCDVLSPLISYIELSGKILSIDDLRDVYTKFYDARDKWCDIGLYLNVKESALKSIKKEQLNNQGDCLREMLAHRIQSGGPLTWNDLCHCLRCPTVGRRDLANEIIPGLIETYSIKCSLFHVSFVSVADELKSVENMSSVSSTKGQCITRDLRGPV